MKGSRACTLWMIMAACAFIVALGELVRIFLARGPLTRAILAVEGVDAGVWLGVFLSMRIMGMFDQNKSRVKIGESDSNRSRFSHHSRTEPVTPE